jgi:anti-anti-sigma factor
MRTAVMPAQRACAVSVVQVRVHEDLDLVSIGQIGAVLDTALGLRPVRLVVDMAGCAFVDAAGISLLLDAHRRASQYDGLLLLRSVRRWCGASCSSARVDSFLGVEMPTERDETHRLATDNEEVGSWLFRESSPH